MAGEVLSQNVVWVLLCSFLVALMQAGFTCLESGIVRNKNSINVAVKNLVDFCVAGVLFSCIGFGLMFGPSNYGLFGAPVLLYASNMSAEYLSFFIFEMMFVGTAATIISGAVAERMRFIGYMIITVIVTGFIYPLVGHWAWNGLFEGEVSGWLGAMGFMDFAGASVVHSTAGWVALAAIIVIGPRLGRFGEHGHEITGHNLPMSTLGVFLLWIGFFGFNAGSALGLDAAVPSIVVNTVLGGAAGGVTALLASWAIWKHPVVTRIINGVIAGLVSICAGVNVISLYSALIIGGGAGLVCVYSMWLLERYQLDDVIGAVPSHLCSGIWGTLIFVVFIPKEELLAETYLNQLAIQALGVFSIGIFSFGVSYCLISFANRFIPFRVSEEDERVGLNVSEHKEETSLLDLITQMDSQARSGDFSQPVVVERETEADHIAVFYNSVLERFHEEVMRRQTLFKKLYHMSNYDELTELSSRHMFFECLEQTLSRCLRSKRGAAVLYMDIDGFKAVNDSHGHAVGDELLAEIAKRLKSTARKSDVIARLGGDEFCLIMEDVKGEDDVKVVGDRIISLISTPFKISCGTVNVGVSIGACFFDGTSEDMTSEEIVRLADNAMYEAKLSGKGMLRFS